MSTLAGYYEGARVEVEWRDGHQVIIVRVPRLQPMYQGMMAAALGELLGHGSVNPGRDEIAYELEHDEAVDRRIVELVDLLVAIRYQHPRMMQLELALTPEEQEAISR
jgi:hypothetical protein